MRKLITKTAVTSSVLVLVATTAPAVVINTMASDRAAGAQEAVKTRLEGAKLKACETRERIINDILERIAKRGERRLSVYTAIFERLQDFYTNKGLNLANYDELVADVEAKKAAAQAALDETKANEVDFKCDGSDPKGAAASFKEDLKAEIKALHDYQQSIKNLIVAVKTSLSDAANNASGEGE